MRAESDDYDSINLDFVQRMSMSKLCPMSYFLLSETQNINPELFFSESKVCPELVQHENWLYFQPQWTVPGQALDFSVQPLSRCIGT